MDTRRGETPVTQPSLPSTGLRQGVALPTRLHQPQVSRRVVQRASSGTARLRGHDLHGALRIAEFDPVAFHAHR